ncbi:hypothetical protein PR202_ga17870 [Eleusine coracana subsp. coracana]|uniref:Uncharacterized protein n=1 Tax=Eleusine coracana subsp. coracana TaxID=191504 RepID=A0AAV5CQ22_ELECO|nr:hypothetical protein PR202_ga17870 [Eleusine coracana subsp. coracana]
MPGISYSWRSIIRGIQALKKGLIWRVGDGRNINIWLDPWLPTGSTRRPITPRGQTKIDRVADLINPATGEWDRELIEDIFWEEDRQNILAIPLNSYIEETLAWHFDNKGLFSVKSAYHVLQDEQVRDAKKQRGESSVMRVQSVPQKLNWVKLWSLPYTPKLKQFMWRLGHNSLPLRKNIERRGMEIDTLCPMCHRLDEDGGHCFLKCKMVKKCWQQMNMEGIRLELLKLSSATEVVQTILDLEEKSRLQTITLLWAWWDSRNKTNAGEKMRMTQEVIYMAMNAVSDVSIMKHTATMRVPKIKKRWIPPPIELLKINFDAAFFADSKSGGWGFIVRDHDGDVIMAGAGKLNAVQDALCAEAHAGLIALQFAGANGMSRIQLETDSTCLAAALTSTDYDQGVGGTIFKEIREYIDLQFDVVRILSAPRLCNSVAHELAHYSVGRDSDQTNAWTDPLPGYVSNLVGRDLAGPTINK